MMQAILIQGIHRLVVELSKDLHRLRQADRQYRGRLLPPESWSALLVVGPT
jgi:hypothetical protein